MNSKKLVTILLFTLITIASDCQNEDNCSGNGGIVVNNNILNQVSINIGETFSYDLLGENPLFTHPDNLPILLTILKSDHNLADVLIDPNIATQTLFITGRQSGTFELIIRAVDDCAGDLAPRSKKIQVSIL